MSLVINSITCQELIDGFEEGIDGRGPYAVKKYLCNWADRYAVANGLLGLGPNIATNQALHAHVYPESPNMYAQTVSIEPVGRPSQGTKQQAWTNAIVTADYGVGQYNALPTIDPSGAQGFNPDDKFIYATQELNIGGDLITVPGSALEYSDAAVGGRTPLTQDNGLYICVIEMSLTLHKLPYLPMAASVTAAAAPLNDVTFLGAPRGKVRFNGANTKRVALSDGSISQESTFSFSYRPIADWNFGPHPTTGTFTYIVKRGTGGVTGTGTGMLAYSDLNSLIPNYYKY